MGLNHPETNPLPPPSPVRGKTVFHKTGPQCPKGWDCCSDLSKGLQMRLNYGKH